MADRVQRLSARSHSLNTRVKRNVGRNIVGFVFTNIVAALVAPGERLHPV